MKILKKTSILFCFLSTVIFTNCSPSDDDPENNAPSIFSANTIETTLDGATIEWTAANDSDDDTVSYAIFLENVQITENLPGYNYTFSGLEPETSYDGYVEARDGRGGTSRADFFFTTEPEVIIMEIPITVIEYENETTSNCSNGVTTRLTMLLGAEVPKYEGTTTYKAVFGTVIVDGFTFSGATVSWDNNAKTTSNIRVLDSGDFFPYQSAATFGCSNNPDLPKVLARYQAAAQGRTATVTIVRSKK